MHIKDAVRGRRAIKGYDSSFSLTREEKDHLLDLALHVPPAFNLQHVQLVEVSDSQLRTQLRGIAQDRTQVTDATMLVMVCAQLDSWERNAQRVWGGAPEVVQAFMAGAIDTYYHGKPQVQHDEAMRSCGLLAQTLVLVARGQGPDSCSMDGFGFDAVARLINLSDNHVIGLMVVVGKRAVGPWPRSGKLPRGEPVIRDRF